MVFFRRNELRTRYARSYSLRAAQEAQKRWSWMLGLFRRIREGRGRSPIPSSGEATLPSLEKLFLKNKGRNSRVATPYRFFLAY